MTNRRLYTTANLPRVPWPGETAAAFTPPDLKTEIAQAAFDELTTLRQRVAELEAENDMLVEESLVQADNAGDPFDGAQDALRQRVAELEAAARAVCDSYECEVSLALFENIEELGRVIEGTL